VARRQPAAGRRTSATHLQALLDAGAELVQPVQDIGGGGLRVTVKDADGNAIGLLQAAA